MKDSQEITQWLAKRLWIIVLAIIVGMSVWIMILSNSNSNHALENKVAKEQLKTLENKDKIIERKNKSLKEDLKDLQSEYDDLYQKYIVLLNDEEYKDKNPVNFIDPDGKWEDVESTIRPVANGESELTDRFID